MNFSFYHLLNLSLDLYRSNSEQAYYHRLAKKTCADLIHTTHQFNQGELKERVYKKIQWYMVSTFFMGKLLNILFEEKLDQQKTKLLFCTGAMIGVSDILIDDFKYSKSKMDDLFFDKYKAEKAIEKIFKLYLNEVLNQLDPDKKDIFLKTLTKGGYEQIDSAKQFDKETTEAEICRITENKGGMSILICAVLFDHYDAQFEQALFQIGGFVQYLNDAQDLHKDAVEGIKTFYAFRKDFDDVLHFLETQKEKSFQAVFNTAGLTEKKKSRFLFSFFVLHAGVCYKIRQYQKILNNNIDLDKIKNMDKQVFRINMSSFSAISYVLGQVRKFRK